MKINDIIRFLETIAPPQLQESYDNSGLIVGNAENSCQGILTTLDVTEAVVHEAAEKKCNLIIAHHPVIFRGLKKLNGKNYVERTVIDAIKKDIAIYAIHTNLDNVIAGVNSRIADKLQLIHRKVLAPRKDALRKLVTFVPSANAKAVRQALFNEGAGSIGNYDSCSFNVQGEGTFRPLPGSDPYIGEQNKMHSGEEIRIEVIFPAYHQGRMIQALKTSHPYEEVAYYLQALENVRDDIGSGLVGDLPVAVSEGKLLQILKDKFGLSVIRHTPLLGQPVQRVAICGGAGYFLLPNAIAAGAQVFITGDVKYHEFFDADGNIMLADIGHFESEQFTIELLTDILQKKYANFAVLKTEIRTNPVNYFI